LGIVRWTLWTILASMCGGFLVAAALGGVPTWAWLLLGCLLIAGAIVAAKAPRWERSRLAAAHSFDDHVDDGDSLDTVNDVCRTLPEPDLYWLEHEDFSSPWKAQHIKSFQALARLDTSALRVSDPVAAAAIDELVKSTRSFLDCYDRNTMFEDIVLTHEWRQMRNGHSGTDRAGGLGVRRAELRRRAREAVQAASHLREIARSST
jgi:hypothetical protein